MAAKTFTIEAVLIDDRRIDRNSTDHLIAIGGVLVVVIYALLFDLWRIS
jgi:hypothetical protein